MISTPPRLHAPAPTLRELQPEPQRIAPAVALPVDVEVRHRPQRLRIIGIEGERERIRGLRLRIPPERRERRPPQVMRR